MKKSMKTAAFAALSLSAGQSLAFETEIERAGMLYLNVPLNTHPVPKMDKAVLGFRFGQTRTSTDSVGSLLNYFRKRPALFDVQFGLLDLKLTGISSVEKTYINGQAIVGGVIASKVLMGAAAVGGTGIAAAASSSSDDDSDDDSSSSSYSDGSSSSDNDDHGPEHHAEYPEGYDDDSSEGN